MEDRHKRLELGIYFHRGPTGEPGRGLVYRGLQEMVEGGSREGASLSEEAHCGGPLGKAPLLGTLGYEKLWGLASLLMGAQFHNLECPRLLGTLING